MKSPSINPKDKKVSHDEPSAKLKRYRPAAATSLHLQIGRSEELSMFEPHSDLQTHETPGSSIRSNRSGRPEEEPVVPEKKLTLFALRLSLLEKTASGLGTLGFIWATVVLLGGFASTLLKIDFWMVTVILVVEGARVFGRSHELEWQHEAKWSLTDAAIDSCEEIKNISNEKEAPKSVSRVITTGNQMDAVSGSNAELAQRIKSPRTWKMSDVPLLPYIGWIFVYKNVSWFLYYFQLVSAAACVTLSLLRLIQQNFGPPSVNNTDTEARNRQAALSIFYGLAFAEGTVFLAEKAYWEWTVRVSRIFQRTSEECKFGKCGVAWVRRFFYDAYSKCVNGSVFDGVKMDLLSFAAELLLSDSIEEQIAGAHMLVVFTSSDQFKADAFRKIGTSEDVMARLVEMLSWRSRREEEIRKCAAKIISKITGKKQNSLRVASIPGAMESISSLLEHMNPPLSTAASEKRNDVNAIGSNYDYVAFNLLGLSILKKLANDHDNCGKIGTTRGLLSRMVDLTKVTEELLIRSNGTNNPESDHTQMLTLKRSLKLLKKLTGATGHTGNSLRQELSSIVFTVSNLRDVLRYGETHIELQLLAIDGLSNLAHDDDAKEKIGSTGGIFDRLFGIFFREEPVESETAMHKLKNGAGEALVVLALESKENCGRMMRLEGVVDGLIRGLRQGELSINCMRILRNLCTFCGEERRNELAVVVDAAPIVLKAVMTTTGKAQEAAIGLSGQGLRFMRRSQFEKTLEDCGIQKSELAEKLMEILYSYPTPSIKVPRIRRFVVEVLIWMMNEEEECRKYFRELDLEKELKRVGETTSAVESYNLFSGSVGLSPHTTSLTSLLDDALVLLRSKS